MPSGGEHEGEVDSGAGRLAQVRPGCAQPDLADAIPSLACTRRSVEGSTSAFLYHAVCTLVFCRVWLWHLTPQAAALPGAQGFGWFFRYLTFCSFTLQTILFFSSCLSELVKVRVARPVMWRGGLGS